ncbi:MAG: dihydropteroate synthase [Gammaproteobacteria bacterium]
MSVSGKGQGAGQSGAFSFPAAGCRFVDYGQPRVMGILNVTPDSFSDGGRYLKRERAIDHAATLIREGADLLDIGGESTRPGATAVAVDEELERVIPVIEAVRARFDVPISIDTSKAEVMRAAVAAGADLINDVYALRRTGALEAAAESGAAVCLMHMQGEPRTMQEAPRYGDVVEEVARFLEERVAAALDAGISRDRLIIDPGFGFGKTLEHNLELLRRLPELKRLGLPILVGLSRKSMIGQLLDRSVAERVPGSVTLAALAVWQGAAIVRVHDVRETVEAVRITSAIRGR